MGGSRSWWVWKGGEGEQAEGTTAACWGFWVAQLWGVQTRPPATTFRSRGASTAPPTQLQPWYISEKATLPWRLQVMESPPRTHTDCLIVYLPAPLQKKNSCCISTACQQSAILPQPPTWSVRVYFSFARNPSSGKGSTATCHGFMGSRTGDGHAAFQGELA